MQKHQLKRKNKNKKSVQIGRGGKRGKTSGRGHKGQKARAGAKIRPAIRDVIKKLPKLRGYRFNSFKEKPAIINLSLLEKSFTTGDIVNPSLLVKKEFVVVRKGAFPLIKILGTGVLTKKLTITNCMVSESARQAIEKVGGIIK
ncbi:MAG: uL15 family ribosomal protein [Candidatus Pacebacteria bacterium]|nr:uL15 family ribosomal protein [Candidatus Paceibacterota bacterium]